MKKIAIIGYGVVGGGITAVLEANYSEIKKTVGDDVSVKYILDLREFPDSPYADRIVHDIDIIANDPEIELVCETMGGSHPALEFSLVCLKKGKSVVTSNKEVVANFGDVLLSTARENGVTYMFEASVGGGIPVIRPFYTSLSGDKISSVCGILNGTTNYILTKMKNEGKSFDDVLKEAQLLGFAEANPSADIDGIDAKRKIIILTALASGILASENEVYAGTLRSVTEKDIKAAEKWGGNVKLIAKTNIGEGFAEAYVCPMFVPYSCPLSFISDVYNGISVTSPTTGDIMYYGRGAGRFPTAGAVMADICAVLSGAVQSEAKICFEKAKSGYMKPFSNIEFTYYFRFEASLADVREVLEPLCDKIDVLSDNGGIVEVIAGKMNLNDMEKVSTSIGGVQSVIRVLD